MNLLPILNPLLALAFGATAAVYFMEFLRGPGQRIPAARFFLAGTLGLGLVRFGIFLQVLGRPPLAGPGEAFTTIALSVAIVYALLEFLHGEHSTGFLLLLVAAAFQAIGVVAPPAGTEVNKLLGMPWFGVHVLTAILGYTAFAVGAVYATLFLLLYGDLKRRRFGFVYERVPSLEVLSGMAIRTAALGFGFLTLAIVVGAFGWVRELDHSMLEDPKVMSSLLVWIVYGIALTLHRFTGWRGIRSIGITLAAFVLMVLSSWLVPAFLRSAHDVKELL
ncbi:MAG TPA: cytochrome c biogenesis protein CcsA [bacterium]|nr:cytochrome c biogenesis protein CcsA [bacterium]